MHTKPPEKKKHHFLLTVPLSRTLSSKLVSSSGFKKKFQDKLHCFEERASCWRPDLPVTLKSVEEAVTFL